MVDTIDISASAPRCPDSKPEMWDEWQAWLRVCDALRSASVSINEEPCLAAALEMWAELLVRLRLTETDDIRETVLGNKIATYNRLCSIEEYA